MKIAYVTSGRINSFMADTVHILQSCDSFQALGHEVELFACAGDVDSQHMQETYGLSFEPCCTIVKCFDWPSPWLRFSRVLNSLRIARQVSKEMPFDVIYGRDSYVLMGLVSSSVPLILEAHEMPGPFERHTLKLLFTRRNFRRLVVITNVLRDDYLNSFPELASKEVIVVPNGVKETEIVKEPIKGDVLSGRPGAKQVGYVGALYPGKGIEIIVKVAPLLPEVDFHIVGGRPEDISYWKLKGLAENIYFHGLKARSEIPRIIDLFDVALLPSQPVIRSFAGIGNYGRWTSPMKLFEYMGRGKAIIASDLPVLSEVIEDGKTALIAVANDPSSWVEKLRQLLNDDDLRIRLGKQAREKCLSEFTTQACADRRIEGIMA